jgi:hypothetical protein
MKRPIDKILPIKRQVEIESNHEKTNRQNIAHQETSGTLCQKLTEVVTMQRALNTKLQGGYESHSLRYFSNVLEVGWWNHAFVMWWIFNGLSNNTHIYTIGFEFHFVLPVCVSLYPTLLDLCRNHFVGKLLF